MIERKKELMAFIGDWLLWSQGWNLLWTVQNYKKQDGDNILRGDTHCLEAHAEINEKGESDFWIAFGSELSVIWKTGLWVFLFVFFYIFLLLFMLLRDMFDMTHVMLSHMQMSFCYQWCSFPNPSCRPALVDFVIKTHLMCSLFICILMKMSL